MAAAVDYFRSCLFLLLQYTLLLDLYAAVGGTDTSQPQASTSTAADDQVAASDMTSSKKAACLVYSFSRRYMSLFVKHYLLHYHY